MRRAYFCEGVFARKRWGKTTFLARRAEAEAAFASVTSVLIIDPPDSFRDVASLAGWCRWTSWADFQAGLESRGWRVPRINVFCFGADVTDAPKYQHVFDFAIELGNSVLIVDEVQLFAPKAGKSFPALVKIAAMGRHLPNGDGDERQVCLIVSSQTWNGVGLDVRNQLGTVICGQISGFANHRMLSAEVHKDAEAILSRLKPHEWAVLAPDGGKLPLLAPMTSIK